MSSKKICAKRPKKVLLETLKNSTKKHTSKSVIFPSKCLRLKEKNEVNEEENETLVKDGIRIATPETHCLVARNNWKQQSVRVEKLYSFSFYDSIIANYSSYQF